MPVLARASPLCLFIGMVQTIRQQESNPLASPGQRPAVHDVELITQQNAAMVEENNAEIQGLRQRVDMLSDKVNRFRTGDEGEAHGYGRADGRWAGRAA